MSIVSSGALGWMLIVFLHCDSVYLGTRLRVHQGIPLVYFDAERRLNLWRRRLDECYELRDYEPTLPTVVHTI